MRTALASLALMFAGSTVPVHAAYEASVGYVEELDDETTWTAHVTWLSDHRHPWEVTGGYIAGRDEVPPEVSVNPEVSPDTFYVSLAKRYVHRTGFFFAGGIAFTNTSGDDEALSGPIQFVNGIGWQGKQIVVAFRHISNGSFRGRNRGENILTVGWRF